ncbi:MAG TPA: alpha/beta fold hydrolase [Thermoanaerobaculia bacterium]|nr:alpha/beta fold hydrolase [Thermoanaerobaculia bacterium]
MIWALHGFLGNAADWNPFREQLEAASGAELRAVNLFDRPLAEETPARWAVRFTRSVRNLDSSPILLGYSLGGRLALHALLEQPRLFSAAIIVSAGLGVEGEAERQKRRVVDDSWAARFESDDWSSVIESWNAQPVFGGSGALLPRQESDFDRQALTTALRWWSPAVQEPLGARLPEIETPILWIAGERDATYAEQGRRAVELLPRAELWIAPDAGHRVPWDVPEEFTARVGGFLS